MADVLDKVSPLLWKAEDWVTQQGGAEYTERGNGTTALLAFPLGIGFGLGVALWWWSETLGDFGLYLAFLSLFHETEYLLVAAYRPFELSGNSCIRLTALTAFLINHSNEYTLAALACLLEYFLEWEFLSVIKGNRLVMFVGFVVTLTGLILRILAQQHAKHNFTHEVAHQKRDAHVLVSDGIYKYCRHPGYFGWFWYTVGSQIVLANPVCLAGFAYVSYLFFADRIRREERKLVQFFGDSYVEYRSKTPTYIPGIL